MDRIKTLAIVMIAVGSGFGVVPGALAAPKGPPVARAAAAVRVRPLSSHVMKALAWLAQTQLKSGGWSQGEESAEMGGGQGPLRDSANIADTCAATLALIRAGNTATQGPYANHIRAAVAYVCGQIEEADSKGLGITKVTGTRLQMKLGPYIDTFMASLLLAEVKGKMGDAKGEKRVAAAFHKVMDKIEKNQRSDGTWERDGWAPALSQVVASKAMNTAAQNGLKVDEKVRQKAEFYARSQYQGNLGGGMGGFGGGGSAGVPLYAAASSLGALQASDITNGRQEEQTRATLRKGKTASERKAAAANLKRIGEARNDLHAAQGTVIQQLNNPQFVAGFGSNGGEEFLSYMNIGESLALKGGPEWEKWDRSMTENLYRIQNGDGTWTGHHCITGRTFCTAAAVMVLTVDRATAPLAPKIGRR